MLFFSHKKKLKAKKKHSINENNNPNTQQRNETKPKHSPQNQTQTLPTNKPNSTINKTKTKRSNKRNTDIMMQKLSSPALALFVTVASQASLLTVKGLEPLFALNNGGFYSCPNSGEMYLGLEQVGDPNSIGISARCTPYPGQPLSNATTSAAAVSVSDDPGLNGWTCYPPGEAECPAGFAISEMCASSNGFTLAGAPNSCVNYCTTPGFFAIKCVPNPAADVPLNAGEWLPAPVPGSPTPWKSTMCDVGSVLCGVCLSGNESDCQGGQIRGKCCKYHTIVSCS
jgi:hypothetical protein